MTIPINGQASEDDSPVFPYTAGFQNVTETKEPVHCEVEGEIPNWVNGVLYRIGPGIYDIEIKPTKKKFSFQHWFDGIGLLHRFEISNGNVSYRSRFTADKVREVIESGQLPPLTFGQKDPCKTLFGRWFTLFRTIVAAGSDAANLNVTITPKLPVKSKDGEFIPEMVAKTDANVLVTFDKDTLETKRFFSYANIDSNLNGFSSAAHEEYDPFTDSYYNYTNFNGVKCGYKVFEVKKSGESRQVSINIEFPLSYIHSMASTRKYLVLIACPFYIAKQGGQLLLYRNFIEGSFWDPSKPVIFYVIEKLSFKHVASYRSTEPFFFFHSVNAFDKDDDIFIDLVCSPDATAPFKTFYLENLRDFNGEQLHEETKLARFHLENVSQVNLKPGNYTVVKVPEFLADCSLELPRINDDIVGGKSYRFNEQYQYVYGVSTDPKVPSHFMNSLVKIDISTKSFKRYFAGNGMTPGEPIFLARPDSNDEDDGVILSVVLDGWTKKSFLVVIDAESMKEIGRANIPTTVPFGFHGSFVRH